MEEVEKERRWCVYIHTNKYNNKVYIGITSQNPERRWQNGYGYKENPYFWRAIQKYGWSEGFNHIIFANDLTKDDAEHMEVLLIAMYESTNQDYGYNIEIGGSSARVGVKHSDETKLKMSEKQKKRFKNPDNHPMRGKHHSEESKAKISASQILRYKLNPHQYCDTLKINVCQYNKNGDLLDKFFGVASASQKTGISRSAIENCLCGLSRTAGGYIWKRDGEELTDDDIIEVNTRKPRGKDKTPRIKKTTYNKTGRYNKWYDKQKCKWRVRFLVENQKPYYLGTFKTEEEANEAIIKHNNNFKNKEGKET